MTQLTIKMQLIQVGQVFPENIDDYDFCIIWETGEIVSWKEASEFEHSTEKILAIEIWETNRPTEHSQWDWELENMEYEDLLENSIGDFLKWWIEYGDKPLDVRVIWLPEQEWLDGHLLNEYLVFGYLEMR